MASQAHSRPPLDVTDPVKLGAWLQWLGDRVETVVSRLDKGDDRFSSIDTDIGAVRDELNKKRWIAEGRSQAFNFSVKVVATALLVTQAIQAAVGFYYFVLR